MLYKFVSGPECRNPSMRNDKAEKFFNSHQHAMAVLELKGYLFFGTSSSLFDSVKKYASETNPSLRILVLDFLEVPGIDFTAVMGFSRVKLFLEQREILLFISNLPDSDRDMFAQALYLEPIEANYRITPTTGHAVESAVNHLLSARNMSGLANKDTLSVMLGKGNWSSGVLEFWRD